MKYLRIHGPVLVGFDVLFDRSYGNPRTPKPYPRVTPTQIGSAILPFPCPYCGAVRPQLVDPKKGTGYADLDRGFSWCPACGGRFVLVRPGRAPLARIEIGATWAPALVERKGEASKLVGVPVPCEALSLLGCTS